MILDNKTKKYFKIICNNPATKKIIINVISLFILFYR